MVFIKFALLFYSNDVSHVIHSIFTSGFQQLLPKWFYATLGKSIKFQLGSTNKNI